VPSAGDPLDVAGARPDGQKKASVEGASDPANRTDAERFVTSAFDAGDRLIGHASEASDVELAQAAPNPQVAQEGTDPLIVHGRKAAKRRSPRGSPRLPGVEQFEPTFELADANTAGRGEPQPARGQRGIGRGQAAPDGGSEGPHGGRTVDTRRRRFHKM